MFTFGGTGTVLYGAKLGIEKAFPDAMDNGVPGGGLILASAQSHYCRLNVAGWLGLGEKSVVAVPTHLENDIRVDRLEAVAREALDQGWRLVALVATMGTTDAFGVDDLDAIADLRDRLVKEYNLDYRPHIHADAVIGGWAWSVFNDYDFEANPLGFRPRTVVRALASARRRISSPCAGTWVSRATTSTGAPRRSRNTTSVLRAALQRAGTSGGASAPTGAPALLVFSLISILLHDRLTSVSWPVQENRVRFILTPLSLWRCPSAPICSVASMRWPPTSAWTGPTPSTRPSCAGSSRKSVKPPAATAQDTRVDEDPGAHRHRVRTPTC